MLMSDYRQSDTFGSSIKTWQVDIGLVWNRNTLERNAVHLRKHSKKNGAIALHVVLGS